MYHRRFSLVFVFSLLIVTSLAAASADESNDDDVMIRQVVDADHVLNTDHHFRLFKRKFGQSYGTNEEHEYRFSVFKANLRRARRHQKLDPSAVHGVTQFSDMTPAEFRRHHLGLKGLRLPNDANKAPILPTKDLPIDFD